VDNSCAVLFWDTSCSLGKTVFGRSRLTLCAHTSLFSRLGQPDNVGFKADGTLKILDFGLAKAIPKDETARQKVRMTGETGSIRYMAPEVALHKQYNQKADIFSWSFIVWEMATLTKPFEGYTKHDFFTNVVKGGERPPLNKRWPKEFAELLQACWDTNQNKRPEMAEVCEALKVGGGREWRRVIKGRYVEGFEGMGCMLRGLGGKEQLCRAGRLVPAGFSFEWRKYLSRLDNTGDKGTVGNDLFAARIVI